MCGNRMDRMSPRALTGTEVIVSTPLAQSNHEARRARCAVAARRNNAACSGANHAMTDRRAAPPRAHAKPMTSMPRATDPRRSGIEHRVAVLALRWRTALPLRRGTQNSSASSFARRHPAILPSPRSMPGECFPARVVARSSAPAALVGERTHLACGEKRPHLQQPHLEALLGRERRPSSTKNSKACGRCDAALPPTLSSCALRFRTLAQCFAHRTDIGSTPSHRHRAMLLEQSSLALQRSAAASGDLFQERGPTTPRFDAQAAAATGSRHCRPPPRGDRECGAHGPVHIQPLQRDGIR